MVQITNLKMLVVGIIVLLVPIVGFYLLIIEGMWTGDEYDWIGTISMVVFIGLGFWAIREGFASSPTIDTPISLASS